MSLSKSFVTGVVLISLLTGRFSVANAQGPCVGGMCRHGIARHRCLEVGCAPRSEFYNYYPTTWRRWPTDMSAATPTPAVAPPANQEPSTSPGEQETAPQVQPEQPGQPQITEDDTILPGETAPGATAPEPAPPLPADEEMLPFQDAPSSPAAPPSQDAPPALPPDSITDPGLPGLPPSTTPSLPEEPPGGTPDMQEDAPPTMPEDPFKDDPVQPPTTPAAPTGMNDATGPALSSNNLPHAKSWRAATAEPGALPVPAVAKSLVPDESRVAPSLLASYPSTDPADASPAFQPEAASQPAIESSGPQLLPPVDHGGEGLHNTTLPHGAPARRNPLRMASAMAEARPVVPAAAWDAEDAKPQSAAAGNVRRNPLRSN